MIKAATKAEVVQVAHDLLDPLLETVHQDVENLRAQIVFLEKRNEKLHADLIAARNRFNLQVNRHTVLLDKVLSQLAEKENRS